ncbi:MAG: hypothetical protein JJT94_05310 [Bernardetiaceae bacterium]|nr:hypothetical protein [Bernardetiaceae bacterium]
MRIITFLFIFYFSAVFTLAFAQNEVLPADSLVNDSKPSEKSLLYVIDNTNMISSEKKEYLQQSNELFYIASGYHIQIRTIDASDAVGKSLSQQSISAMEEATRSRNMGAALADTAIVIFVNTSPTGKVGSIDTTKVKTEAGKGLFIGTDNAGIGVYFNAKATNGLHKDAPAFIARKILNIIGLLQDAESLEATSVATEGNIFYSELIEATHDLVQKIISPDCPPYNLKPYNGKVLKDLAGWFSDADAKKLETEIINILGNNITIITAEGTEDFGAYGDNYIAFSYYCHAIQDPEEPAIISPLSLEKSEQTQLLFTKNIYRGEYDRAILSVLKAEQASMNRSSSLGWIFFAISTVIAWIFGIIASRSTTKRGVFTIVGIVLATIFSLIAMGNFISANVSDFGFVLAIFFGLFNGIIQLVIAGAIFQKR